jgi:hypothetical protein
MSADHLCSGLVLLEPISGRTAHDYYHEAGALVIDGHGIRCTSHRDVQEHCRIALG